MKSQASNKPSLVVKNGIHGRGVFATRKIHKNTIIFKMHGEFVQQPTQTSVQIGDNMHIEDALAGLVNHSCKPTAKVDRQMYAFLSVRDIEPNEEITFNYNINEEEMAAPFTCECCGKKICGKKS